MSALNIKDYIYEKEFTCLVCKSPFKSLMVRQSKIKFVTSDVDLMAHYTPIEPILYEVLLCQSCGHAVPQKFQNKMSSQAADSILARITPSFKPRQYSDERTVDEAIELYKLSLLSASIKLAPDSEQGYNCMKLAWLYRMVKHSQMELEYIEKTIQLFNRAYTKEDFPICDFDEETFSYMLAAFYFLTDKPEDCLKWLGKVIGSKTANPRLKDRSFELKNQLKTK